MSEWTEEHMRKMAEAEQEAGCINIGSADEMMQRLAIDRISELEAALSEAQDHLEKEKGFFARMMHERNEHRQQITQQAATISQLRGALEKAKHGLETAGMGARYIDQALANVHRGHRGQS